VKTIPRIWQNGKNLLGRVPEGVLTLIIVVLASGASFGLGILAGQDMREGDVIIKERELTETLPKASPEAVKAATVQIPSEPAIPAGGQYVASRNGSKYHLPWCAGAKAMNEANKIWFATKEAAEAAGYTPASNCKGL